MENETVSENSGKIESFQETPNNYLNAFLQKEGRVARKIIIFYVVWLVLFQTLLWIHILENGERKDIAILSMSLGLIVFWIFIGGSIMRFIREPLRLKLQKHTNKRVLKFFLFATLLACIEEIVTTGMTNTAPLWGFSPHEVYITASPNYFEVIFLHSVIVFLPAFLVWGILLEKYRFHPNWVLLLYGLTGTISETMSFGPQNMLYFAFWGLVYGLIVYLPAYSLPKKEERKKPNIFHYTMAVVLPLLATIPMAILVMFIHSILGI